MEAINQHARAEWLLTSYPLTAGVVYRHMVLPLKSWITVIISMQKMQTNFIVHTEHLSVQRQK